MTTEIVNIRRFNPNQIATGSIILVLGERGTGKTTFIKNCLLHSFRGYPMGIVMVGTCDTEEEYARHCPPTLIYNDFRPEVIDNMIQQQDKRRKKVAGQMTKQSPPMFLIIDDLTYKFRQVNKDPGILKLFFNGRHYNVTVVISAHYCMQISKELRGQFDYVVTTYQKNPMYRKQIRECFDVGFPNNSAFHEVMRVCTKNYGVMILDKRARANYGLEDSVFQYRAIPNLPFRIGHRSLWEMHSRRYNQGFVTKSVAGLQVRIIDKVSR